MPRGWRRERRRKRGRVRNLFAKLSRHAEGAGQARGRHDPGDARLLQAPAVDVRPCPGGPVIAWPWPWTPANWAVNAPSPSGPAFPLELTADRTPVPSFHVQCRSATAWLLHCTPRSSMEVDIAPQFGAELKVPSMPPSHHNVCYTDPTSRRTASRMSMPGCVQLDPYLPRPHPPLLDYPAAITHMADPTNSGLRRHSMAGRHPTVLPRTKRHRARIRQQAQCSGKEVL